MTTESGKHVSGTNPAREQVSEANLAEGWDPDGSAGRAGRARALPGHRIFWRSLEEKEAPERLAEEAHGSDVTKQTIGQTDLTRLKRRHFLTQFPQ